MGGDGPGAGRPAPGRARLSGDVPGNLAPAAVRDLRAILRSSAERFGTAVARETRTRLLRRCGQVADGVAVGHARGDLPSVRGVAFPGERPWVIVYDPARRVVLRILDGRRDIPAVLR